MTDDRQELLREAATTLCNLAARHIAGDWDVQREDVYAAIEEVRAALAVAQVPATEPKPLEVATWRLSNAASSLARHATHADDPAHRSWFPSAIADVEREVRLARAAAGPEPDYARLSEARHDSDDGEPSPAVPGWFTDRS